MYNPYFRGKQFELITIRESAELLVKSNFTPIIEPVKETLSGLKRTLDNMCDLNGGAVLIVNPAHGDHSDDSTNLTALLEKVNDGKNLITAGVLLRDSMTIGDILECYEIHKDYFPAFIHAGFTEAKELRKAIGETILDHNHIFFEGSCGKLYRKHFVGSRRILIRDGFKRRRNADYPQLEEFSDLHATYDEEGMDEFGDFLIVGDEYSESGGPAYAVAIHLTFIDPDKDDSMYIYHFISDRQDTPTDPAGKFAEALHKLIAKLDTGKSNILITNAVNEFYELHRNGHFPGLGYIKKMSMKHHIETLANYFSV